MNQSDGMETFIYAEPSEFCPRHQGNTVVRRCHHFGEFYVAEVRHGFGSAGGAIDYCRDTEPFVCESHYFTNRQEADAYWAAVRRRMLNGIPPDGDRCHFYPDGLETQP